MGKAGRLVLCAVALMGATVGVVAGGMVAEPPVTLTADLASRDQKLPSLEERLRTADSGELVHGTNVIVGSLPADRLSGGITGAVITDGSITDADLGGGISLSKVPGAASASDVSALGVQVADVASDVSGLSSDLTSVASNVLGLDSAVDDLTAFRDRIGQPTTASDTQTLIDASRIAGLGDVPATDLVCSSVCVQTDEIADGTITGADLGTASVGTQELVDASNSGVPTGIITAKIENGAITNDKLAGGIALSKVPDAASAAALATLTTDFATLINRLITQAGGADTDKLVDASRIANLNSAVVGTASNVDCTGCIDNAELAASGLDAGKLSTGTLSASLLGSGIDATKVTTGTLDGGMVGTGIKAANITDGTIADAQIASLDASKLTGTIDMGRIGANAITGAKVALALDKGGTGGIENNNIELRTIQGDRLAPDAIGPDQLATGAVTTDDLGDAQVTTSKVKSNAASALGWTNISLMPGTASDAPAPEFTGGLVIPAGGNHRVHVTGQAAVLCSGCTSVPNSVSYQLVRSRFDGVALTDQQLVGQLNGLRIDTEDGSVSLPFSYVDEVAPGRYVYQIRVTASFLTGSAELGSVTVNTIDLGRV